MDKFLSVFAQHLYEKYGEELSDSCIVFPNKRAGIFFLEYLNKVIQKPIITPEILSVSQFISSFSSLVQADTLTLTAHLYDSYKRINKIPENFERFYSWGNMILSDFNDIDKQMADAESLFQNIVSLKDIEDKFEYLSDNQIVYIQQFWSSFNPKNKSNEQKEFLKIWSLLHPLYMDFRYQLKKKNLAYEGMIYREVAEKSMNEEIDWKLKKIFCVGMNVLTKSTETIFLKLQNEGRVNFYWDYDDYYVKNPKHEAGFFIRKNLKKFQNTPLNISHNRLSDSNKEIQFYACNSETVQTKLLPEILEPKANKNFDDTVIVLVKEQLALPVLYSIPSYIEQYNITMGFPLMYTPTASWIGVLSALQSNIKVIDDQLFFYFKNVLDVFTHPYFQKSITSDYLIKQIKNNDETYIAQADLHFCDLTKIIFQKVEDLVQLKQFILDALNLIFKNLPNSSNDIDYITLNKEFIFHAGNSIVKSIQSILSNNIKISVENFLKILQSNLLEITVPFFGDPLSSLQIMGLFETRLLDFRHVIVFSANDENLPGRFTKSSFIPYHLRKGFNLPTVENQDSMIAYYFYRLLQGAKKVDVLYNSVAEGLHTGEPSRFLRQLKIESNFSIIEKNVVDNIKIKEKKAISINNNEEVQKKLRLYLTGEKKFSATSLNDYLDCSLKFYYKYVEEIEEVSEIEEDISPLLFGSWFHKIAQNIYSPYLNKVINKDMLLHLIKQEKLIEDVILQSYNEVQETNLKIRHAPGMYLLAKEVLKDYTFQLLNYDLQFTPFTLLHLEKKLETKIPVMVAGKKNFIAIKGTLDRVDLIDNKLRVLDYKTGTIYRTFDQIENLFAVGKNRKGKTAFQTILYCMLYNENNSNSHLIIPGVYALKELYKKSFNTHLNAKTYTNKTVPLDYNLVKKDFKENLINLIETIFKASFNQTTDEKICGNCPYAIICLRD